MIYDKISKQFIDMNPNQIGTETDRFIVLDDAQQIRLTERLINGYEVDVEYVLTGSTPASTLEYLKQVKLNELNSIYTNKLEIGLKYNLNEIDYTFNLDDNTENNIAKQKIDWDIQKTQNDYDEGTITFAITDANKHQVIFDIATFLKFSALFGKALKSLKIAYAAKRNAIYLAQNESELNSIVIEFN